MNPWDSPSCCRALFAPGGDVGAVAPNLVPVFAGWNVWAVWQLKDLGFELGMLGLDRDRRLRIWVEDTVRGAGADVADPLALKGSQVQILNGAPPLKVRMRKENLSIPFVPLSGVAELRFVRFYNRGQHVNLPWPFSVNYLLDQVYEPDSKIDVTTGPPPDTITGAATGHVLDAPRLDSPWTPWIIGGAAVVVISLIALKS